MARRRLVTICCYCKRIRCDKDYWQELELYLTQHASVEFSHGVCPACYDKYWKKELAQQSGKT